MSKIKFCTNCGQKLNPKDNFCLKCGEKVVLDEEEIAEEQKVSIKTLLKNKLKVNNENANVEETDETKKKKEFKISSWQVRTMTGFILGAIFFLVTGYFVEAVLFLIAGIFVSQKVYRKFSGKKKIIPVGITFGCFIIAASIFYSRESAEQFISSVKLGSFQDYPDITVEEMFNCFFAEPTWEYFEGEKVKTGEIQDIVEFTGQCTYAEEDILARIQFVVNEDETFNMENLFFNDVAQSPFILSSMIMTIYETYIDEHGIDSYEATTQKQNNVTVDNCVLVNDESHGLCVDITYSFTNVTNSSNSFIWLYDAQVFQNGVGCTEDFYTNDDSKNIAIGTKYTFTKRYILENTVDDVHILIEPSALNYGDNTYVSVTYKMNELEFNKI